MKNMYRAIMDAAHEFFHNETPEVNFSRRSKRSLRWLSLHARNGNQLGRISSAAKR